MIVGIHLKHREGVEIFTADGELKQYSFPQLLSDNVLEALNQVVKPEEIRGIIVLEEDGSFTAVRTASVVANAISFAREVPAVKVAYREDWRSAMVEGVKRLEAKENDFPLNPHYDREPNITVKSK